MNKLPRCPDCDDGVDRRDFLRVVGATAAAGLPLWATPRLEAAPTPSSTAETAVKALYETLTDAQRKTILRMVLSQGLALALAGAAAGLVGAWIVSHLMTGLLYGVSPSDPLTFISLTVVLVVVALAACYIPARRAMRVDPIVALREA